MHWCIFRDNHFTICILTSATVSPLQWPDRPIQPQTPDNGHGGSQHRAEGKNPAVDQREEVQVLVSSSLLQWCPVFDTKGSFALLLLQSCGSFRTSHTTFNRVLSTPSVNFGVCWQKSRSTSSVTFLADVGWLVFWLIIHARGNDQCSSVRNKINVDSFLKTARSFKLRSTINVDWPLWYTFITFLVTLTYFKAQGHLMWKTACCIFLETFKLSSHQDQMLFILMRYCRKCFVSPWHAFMLDKWCALNQTNISFSQTI